jgi:hypothetical protein
MNDQSTQPTECPDCGVGMMPSNDGTIMCPYCNSWAFRDAVSDGAIYSAVSKRGSSDKTPTVATGRRLLTWLACLFGSHDLKAPNWVPVDREGFIAPSHFIATCVHCAHRREAYVTNEA